MEARLYMKMRLLFVALISVDMALLLLHIFLRKKLGFFDLDSEGNLVSLISGMKLWLAATASWIVAWVLMARCRPWKESWGFILLGMGLAYIGIDDMMGVHERIGFVLNNIFGTGGFYGESFNWLFYFAPFMVLALAVFCWCVLLVWQRHRTTAYWFLSGVALWVLGIGTEWYGRSLILEKVVNVPFYHALIIVEEGLELFGATAITIALVQYAAHALRTYVRVAGEERGSV